MSDKELERLLSKFRGSLVFNCSLKNRNWFNIGGKAKVFYKAENLKELIDLLKLINNKKKIFVLGAGSNVLVADNLFDGIVIKLGSNFNKISILGNDTIIAGGSVLDKKLSTFAMENNLSGFEFLSGIPGTVGGGIRMNAGCFGREFKDILLSVQAIDKLGNIKTISSNEIKFNYRTNSLSKDLIFLSGSFKGKKGKAKEISEKIKYIKLQKELNQPKNIKTGGSTFKNPQSHNTKKAWQLIKESISPDKTFGDAGISNKHYNFFVNKGHATFNDMNNLIKYTQKKVLDKTGIKLKKEIVILK